MSIRSKKQAAEQAKALADMQHQLDVTTWLLAELLNGMRLAALKGMLSQNLLQRAAAAAPSAPETSGASVSSSAPPFHTHLGGGGI